MQTREGAMIAEIQSLTDEQRELLKAAVGNGGSLALFRRSDTRGPAVRTPTHKFFDPRDASVAPRYIDGLKHLVELSLLRPKSSEIYELTNTGWEMAAKTGR
jgi:hypothetical protein